MTVGAQIIIEGMVQGVGFRYFVYTKASRLGLTGFARNVSGGRVEIEVEGDRSLIEELIKFLKVGPPSAHVADVKVDWKKPENQFRSFEIR
ncbi:MAG TPA: acylphosphatase [Bacteroidota bacterium]|nr:acylphosphatase [Bacteroidota bacterium]